LCDLGLSLAALDALDYCVDADGLQLVLSYCSGV
jgi:hypothetical protein